MKYQHAYLQKQNTDYVIYYRMQMYHELNSVNMLQHHTNICVMHAAQNSAVYSDNCVQ